MLSVEAHQACAWRCCSGYAPRFSITPPTLINRLLLVDWGGGTLCHMAFMCRLFLFLSKC
uniref:Uncharacterized protein n=1 Tax=Leptobrachium leishanense TaxID=445787 RepID=A0A8C5M322_9ANUR